MPCCRRTLSLHLAPDCASGSRGDLQAAHRAHRAQPRHERARCHVRRRQAQHHHPGRGQTVQVVVSDTGSGFSAEALEHLFEVGFTTKGDRGGSGNGLSAVAHFVEGAGGSVSVESVVGEGATVIVTLPRVAVADFSHESSAPRVGRPARCCGRARRQDRDAKPDGAAPAKPARQARWRRDHATKPAAARIRIERPQRRGRFGSSYRPSSLADRCPRSARDWRPAEASLVARGCPMPMHPRTQSAEVMHDPCRTCLDQLSSRSFETG